MTTTETKEKWELSVAMAVGNMLWSRIAPAAVEGFCRVVGSVRRGKKEVGDVELLYVPRIVLRKGPGEMFESEHDAVALVLRELLDSGMLDKRKNSDGILTWGPQIKLARHVATGIPVDLFATNEASWWNYLVCRTGPAESNTMIAAAARARGWKWEPYSSGFRSLGTDEVHAVNSEREVFEFVGMKYEEPEQRS